MASIEHEILVAIVRGHPEVLLDLLGRQLDFDGGRVEVLDRSENLTEIRATELRADAVLVMRAGVRPRAAFVVEVQLARDARKRWSWPSYLAVARARLRCPVTLVVLTMNAAIARWCARPIVLDGGLSSVSPHVIGPSAVPLLVGDVARRHPELAVVSVLAHRHEPAVVDTARAVLVACADLDEARAKQYADIVLSSVNQAARRALEAEMHLENYELRSELLRKLEAQAIAQGREEGRLAALACAVLRVLEARRIEVSDEQRAILTGCTDPDELDRWLQRAATVDAADEIFRGLKTAEAEMNLDDYEPQSEFMRRVVAREAQKLVPGIVEERLLAEVRLRVLTQCILIVLRTRGLALTPDQQVTLAACTDPAQLEQWLQRAVLVATTDAMFTG